MNHSTMFLRRLPIGILFIKVEEVTKTQDIKKRQDRGESLVYSDSAEDLGNIEDVDEYMKQLVFLFKGIHRVLKPNRYMTIIIQNLNYKGNSVPIAWQLGILLTETGLWNMKGRKDLV